MEKQYLPEQIIGERISLKRHNVDLAETMFKYVSEDKERLSRFLPWTQYINCVDDEIRFINDANKKWDEFASAHYGLYRNSDNDYMGNISAINFFWAGCSLEIGYWLLDIRKIRRTRICFRCC